MNWFYNNQDVKITKVKTGIIETPVKILNCKFEMLIQNEFLVQLAA